MLFANHSHSTNHHRTLHTGKNVPFSRPNYFPLAAESHLLDQMSFRQLRKGICSTKRASANCGKTFAQPNRLPPTAERHLLGQTSFRQLRKGICSTKRASASSGKPLTRPNAICATATTPISSSNEHSVAPLLPLAAPFLRTSAVKIAFFKQRTSD